MLQLVTYVAKKENSDKWFILSDTFQ